MILAKTKRRGIFSIQSFVSTSLMTQGNDLLITLPYVVLIEVAFIISSQGGTAYYFESDRERR